jgi:hypothetical protein
MNHITTFNPIRCITLQLPVSNQNKKMTLPSCCLTRLTSPMFCSCLQSPHYTLWRCVLLFVFIIILSIACVIVVITMFFSVVSVQPLLMCFHCHRSVFHPKRLPIRNPGCLCCTLRTWSHLRSWWSRSEEDAPCSL